MAAMSGRRSMQSRNVPCWPGTALWLRGTISYQAPVTARSRSITSGNRRERVRSGRSWVDVSARRGLGQQGVDLSGLQIGIELLADEGRAFARPR